jgi:hypothetical protein
MQPEKDKYLQDMIGTITAITGLHIPKNSWNDRIRILKESAQYYPPTKKELTHEISDICDLACRQCSTKANLTGNNKSFEKLRYEFEAIPNVESFEVVRISGGEPFLNRDLIPYVEYLHHKKVDIEILTSGIVNHNGIPHATLMGLWKLHPKIIFSLHGYRSVHENIVAPKIQSNDLYWEKLMQSVDEVSFLRFRHGFHTVAMRSNFDNLRQTAENIAMLREVAFINSKYERGFLRYEFNWHILKFVPQGRGLYCLNEVLSEEQEKELPTILKELSRRYILSITFSNSFEKKQCGAQYNKGVITARGEYIGCSALKEGNKHCLENCN